METASIVASIVSLILGVLAIVGSVYFFTQSKGVETKVLVALEAIKTQTDALQTLNATTMNRLTKFVTTPRDDSHAETLAMTLREIPDIVLRLRVPDTSNEAAWRQQVTDAYIALWNYIAVANVWAAYALPNPEDFIETERNHKLARHMVDRSAADFRYIEATVINKLDVQEIRNSQHHHLYEEAIDLSVHVADTVTIFARRSQQP